MPDVPREPVIKDLRGLLLVSIDRPGQINSFICNSKVIHALLWPASPRFLSDGNSAAMGFPVTTLNAKPRSTSQVTPFIIGFRKNIIVRRPKQFNREELLRKATDMFLHHGFSATSTQQLVETLSINRKSMYAEFSSKQDVFEAVLTHYNKATIGANFGPLETKTAGLAEIEQVILLFAGAARGRGFGLGCLLCNTAVERAANDVATLAFVEHYFDRMTSAFQNALKNARRDGVVSRDLDVISETRFFTSLMLRLAVFVRGKADPDMADGASRIALAHLTSPAMERVKMNESSSVSPGETR